MDFPTTTAVRPNFVQIRDNTFVNPNYIVRYDVNKKGDGFDYVDIDNASQYYTGLQVDHKFKDDVKRALNIVG